MKLMNLRIRNSDPRMIEDEFGNEMFKFVGLHLGDVQDFLNRINGYADLEKEVQELEGELREVPECSHSDEDYELLEAEVDALTEELENLRNSIREIID
jgi:predicted nuclease with TOPRIM domain